MTKLLPARALGAGAIAVVLALLAALLSPVAASAAVSGSVAGVVTLSTGAVGKGVSVQLVAIAGDGSDLARHVSQRVTTASGAFSIPGVAPGEYTLEFGALSGHGMQFLGGATTIAAADTFTVSENRTSYLRAGLVAPGTLSVSVKGLTNTAVAGVSVTAFARNDRDEWTARGSAVTGKTGVAGLALTPGQYRLYARGAAFPPVYSGGVQTLLQATEVRVTRGLATSFAFTAPTTGGVSGTVAGLHDGVAVPKLAGIPVTVLRLVGTPGNYNFATSVTSTVTGPTGVFTATGLLPGVDYTLRFDPPQKTVAGVPLDPRYGTTLLGGTNLLWEANHFTVTAGAVQSVGTQTLTEAGSVTGTVLEYPGFLPAANVPIFARRTYDGNSAQLPGTELTRTAADGTFTVGGLGEGIWAIQAGSSAEEVRLSTTLNGNRYPAITTVTVVAGQSTPLGSSLFATAVNAGNEPALFTPTTVTGTAQVGQTLTAVPPVYKEPVSDTEFFSAPTLAVWLRNGRAIPGAIGTSYTLTGADAGAQVSARIHHFFTTRPWQSSDSAPVTVATGAAPAVITPPAFTTARKVGTPIVATAGTYSLPGTTVGYEWCVDTNDNGDCDGAILGTGTSYTPSSAQQGAEMLVRVTASRAGYTSTIGSYYIGVIGQGTLTVVKLPSVTRKGTVLTASPGTWSALGSNFSYAWSIFDPAAQAWVGLGVSASSLNVKPYAGRALRVLVTATQGGFVSGTSQVTAQVGTAGAPTGATTLPATVSPSTLTAPVPVWSSDTNSSDTTVNWQWQYLKGKKWLALAGRTAATLVVPDSYIGRSLRVVVTARTAGFAPRVLTTNASVVVRHPAPDVPLNVTGAGSAAVGKPLTAAPGSWTVPGVATTYSWQSRATGGVWTTIAAAKSASYTPTEVDFGRELRVIVHGTKLNYAPASVVGGAGVVGNGSLHIKVPGEISTEGDVYRLTLPTFVEGAATLTSVQWSANQPGGSTIAVPGTGLTVPAAGLESRQVLAFVTMSRPKYGNDQTWVVGTSPAWLSMSSPGTLTVPGGAIRVGQALSVGGATFTGVQPAAVSYQWAYSDAGSYKNIPGAVNPTYTPARAYVGRTLAVYVYGHREGYNSSGSIVETDVVAPGFGLNPGLDPVLGVDAVVGVPITATPGGTWSEPASFAYEWKRGSTVISSKATYTPVPSDQGQTLTVTVTGSVPGLASALRGGSTVVQPGTFVATKKPVVSKKGTVLSVSAPTWSKKPTAVVTSWNIYDRATGIATVVTAPKLNVAAHAGKRITVTLTAQLAGYAAATKTVAAQTGRGAAFLSGIGAELIADAAVASAATVANPMFWDLDAVTTGYQWTRNGKAIPGATGVLYPFTVADTGATVAVQITKGSPGYATTSRSFALPYRIPSITPLVATARPVVSGTAVVDGKLSATTGSWNSPGTSHSYQWFTADGGALAIAGATGSTFSPTPELAGASVFVRVTASKPYFTPVVAESNRVAIDYGTAPTPAKLASISRLGGTFTAGLGALPPGFTVSVRWFTVSGGAASPITGATGVTHTTTAVDLGTTYRAVFTATRIGYRPATFATADVLLN
ncbi:carboxypeptidase regulatory-like domain-containing protein [Glaciihabitans arcticus]|uniref:Carboxypeptidase regulatory-like domain-containing protein n=1 Tax=Glaciihabitans arcticus TaxID=2668039 RepID=A0A4Q9GMZ4_9MICO|nr:carboxypeptidase-like regulatory domain-containing protein [Glaciihabitans arcticus]TBN56051.1 carboxypeptidase regulatory-like domain-containing protein [Glaciihabitans arcticus]